MPSMLDPTSAQPSAELVVAPVSPLPGGTFDPDFEARWMAWVAKGKAHELRARRKAMVAAGILLPVTLLLYVLFRDSLSG